MLLGSLAAEEKERAMRQKWSQVYFLKIHADWGEHAQRFGLAGLLTALILLLLSANSVNGYSGEKQWSDPQAPAGITPTATSPAPTAVPTTIPTAVPPPAPTPVPPPVTSGDGGDGSIPESEYACLRINFEVSGHYAREGWYEVREPTGRLLAQWYALDGWQDSGWINDILISFQAVHVEVTFHPVDGTDPVTMAIWNPAPDTPYGWVAKDMCHAVEVGWP
jgi:hypothetical protein